MCIPRKWVLSTSQNNTLKRDGQTAGQDEDRFADNTEMNDAQ